MYKTRVCLVHFISFQLHGLCCLSPFNYVASLLWLCCRAASLLFMSMLLYQLISSGFTPVVSPLLILHMEVMLNLFFFVSHIRGIFVTLCGPVLHITSLYCVSYSFRFLWEKRQKLLHWDRCMPFWLGTKTKKLHQYNMLALGRRKWNQGSTKIHGNGTRAVQRSILQCSCYMNAS